MLLETLMGFQCWKWKWSHLKRSPGENQVCVCSAYFVCFILLLHILVVCICRILTKTSEVYPESFFTSVVCVCTGADLSDYFNYGFNEDTWKAYCEKQKRLRMGLEVLTVGSVTSKITVRCHCKLCFLQPPLCFLFSLCTECLVLPNF